MKYLPSMLLFVLISGILELLVRLQFIPAFLFPAPSQVLNALIEEPQIFWMAFLQTLNSTLVGFCISIFLGTLIAVAFSFHQKLQQAVLPFFILFQIVPIIAIAPLLVIWFGFGPATVRASAVIVSIFPILANTLSGLQIARRDWSELFRSFRASKFQIFLYLQIPSALPDFFNGLRIAAGLSVIGSIVGEFIAGGGLGNLIDAARTQQRLDQVFAALFLSAILGLFMVGLVHLLYLLVQLRIPFQNSRTES